MTHSRPWCPRLAGFALAALMGLAPGSASAQLDDVVQYGRDRFNDFADIFRLRAGVPSRGHGYGAKARVTSLAQLGYVHYNGTYVGLDRRSFGIAREKRTEGGISVFYASQHRMSPIAGNEFLRGDTDWSAVADRRILLNKPYWDDGRGDFLGIGAEVATPILALDLGVYPSQAVDFLFGFLTIDLYDDDQLFWHDDHDPDPVPTEWGANPDAATAKKNVEIDAIRARIAEEEMKAEGQMQDTEPPAAPVATPAPEPMRRETSAPPAPAGEKLTKEELEKIDAAAEKETFVPAAPPPPVMVDPLPEEN